MLTFTKSMLALSVMAAVGGVNAATYTVNFQRFSTPYPEVA